MNFTATCFEKAAQTAQGIQNRCEEVAREYKEMNDIMNMYG